jgi:dolichol-phosphate mannosyltransferase
VLRIGELLRTLDIVTSAYNEEECIPELYRRLTEVLSREKDYSWRFLIADNCSTDKTWQVIKALSRQDPRVLGFRMSRNFTLDEAFTAGIDRATADAVVIMCSDLQDPPEVIPLFLRQYELGFEQVLAKIVKRGSVPPLRRFLSHLYYFIANKLTNNQIPRGVSDFRLVTKNVYDSVRLMQERHRFLRGLFAWTGFKTSIIEIERPERFAGESHFMKASLLKAVQWSIFGLFSNSTKPLSLISYFGLASSVISFLLTAISSIIWLTLGVPFAGFGTIVGLVSIGFSILFLFIGIISQYLALMFEELKRRPIYIVAETTDGKH